MTLKEQEMFARTMMPFMNEAARLVELNPYECVVKRPEDFHRNYKYVDNYYQTKHTWNSQKCKCCRREKRFEEFQIRGGIGTDNVTVNVNCNDCIARKGEIGFFERMMLMMISFMQRGSK